MKKKHEFSRLNIVDLLEARSNYHLHLIHLENVVGTAIGRYLIRKSDPDFKDPKKQSASPSGKIRTLSNAAVREWSYPCVLIFVDHWPKLEEIQKSPEEFVPPRLYLPDDRVVPTCVVYAEPDTVDERPIENFLVSKDLLGGGYPVLSQVQGQIRVGSIGALVTNGHTVFALTNNHVAGPPGQPSYMLYEGVRHEIGQAADLSVSSIPFEQGYPTLPGEAMRLNLDAGLIAVKNVPDWTSQVYGIGEVGKPVDVHAHSLTLDLIDQKARAFGGVSGNCRGRILGMFYRYRNRNGVEQVTDFLIGPDNNEKSVNTGRGDSGTLWGIDDEAAGTWHPLAMQWGAASFSGDDSERASSFALASNLTIILDRLGVDILGDWNVGYSPVWGKLGHFQVGAKACDLVENGKLRDLMQQNKELIGLSDDDRRNRKFPKNRQKDFIALADVSDLWWKTYRGKEKPGHFADIDQLGAGEFNDRTLLDLFNDDQASLDPALWLRFYESLDVPQRYQGFLPFRVKQFYEEMVNFAAAGKVAEFVAAAGILSHYLGDAAQPLHTSHLHHGSSEAEKDVHAQYETKMIDRFRDVIITRINERLDGETVDNTFSGSQNAAVRTMGLAMSAAERLPPQEIIDVLNAARQTSNTNNAMWAALGERTIETLIAASKTLAEIWESAWLEGNGNSIPNAKLKKINTSTLRKLYKDDDFIESKWLEEMI